MSLPGLNQIPERYGGRPTEVHAVQGIGLPVDAGARVRMMLAVGRFQSAARCADAAGLPMVPP